MTLLDRRKRKRKRGWEAQIGIGARMRVITRQYNRETNRLVSEKDHGHNLVLDNWLTAVSKGTGSTTIAGSFAACRVGSGTNAVKYNSGAVTFTQSGTTVTASGSFFDAVMVGGILKYGSDDTGVEYYITSYTSPTEVEVDTSATVGSTVGTVWMVQQTALQTLLYSSSTYGTDGGDNFTNYVTNVATLQRTYVFAQQVSSYSVNEVGWNSSTTGSTVLGRIVLGSTEVVNPSNYLVVILQMEITVEPNGSTAVGDVGTNVDTSGNAALSWAAITYVATNGNTVTAVGNLEQSLEVNGGTGVAFYNAAPTLATNPLAPASGANAGSGDIAGSVGSLGNWTNDGLGEMVVSNSFSLGNFNPDTFYGLSMGNGANIGGAWYPILVISFGTPAAFPNEPFVGTVAFRVVFSRQLDNA